MMRIFASIDLSAGTTGDAIIFVNARGSLAFVVGAPLPVEQRCPLRLSFALSGMMMPLGWWKPLSSLYQDASCSGLNFAMVVTPFNVIEVNFT